MIHIQACDDSKEQCDLLNYYFRKYKIEMSCNLKWHIECSSKKLIDQLSTIEGRKPLREIDLFILDVEMPEVNGIELAKAIRGNFAEIPIIFITGFRDYAYEAFGVTAFDYILKPLNYEQFKEMMIKTVAYIQRQREKQRHCLTFQTKLESISISYSKIYYFEKQLRKVRIVHTNGDYTTYLTNRELDKLLEPGVFIRCHQSYYVNINHVSYYRDQCVYLHNNDYLSVSKTYIKALKEAIFCSSATWG